jgi:magnesium transporter
MIKYYLRTEEQENLNNLAAFAPGSWIYSEDLSETEIVFLENEFGLESGHLRDALDPFEVPRLELEESGVYIFSRIPLKEKGLITTTPFLIILNKNFLFTLSEDGFAPIDRILAGKVPVKTAQKLDLLILLLKEVVASYYRHLTDINRKVRKIRASIERISAKDIIQFVDYEQVLNDFISALVPMSANMKLLLSGKAIKLEEESEESIEDLFLSTEQLLETAKTTLKTIVNIREAYSTIMSHDLNRTMKILTSLTIIVTVPTMISSFYGMNIPLPFMHSPWSFLLLLALSLGAVFLLVILFRRNRWL